MDDVAGVLLGGIANLIAPVIAVILIGLRAKGPARRLGLIGALIYLVGAILSPILSAILPGLLRRFDISYSVVSFLFIPLWILDGVGLILIALAVCAGSRNTQNAEHPGGGAPYPPYGGGPQQQYPGQPWSNPQQGWDEPR